MLSRISRIIFFQLIYLFLYVPILCLVVLSFYHNSELSLHWYRVLYDNSAIWQSVWNSLKIAVTAATFSVFLGTFSAFAIARRVNFSSKILNMFVFVPIFLPEVVLGLSFFLFFAPLQNFLGWPPRGFYSVVIGHTTIALSYTVGIIQAQINQIDTRIEEAARNLGAHPYRVFVSITLPLLRPALLSSWLLAFLISFDDVVIASFTAGPQSPTLPMFLFSSVRLGVNPQINAMATVIVVFSAILTIFVNFLMQRGIRRLLKS